MKWACQVPVLVSRADEGFAFERFSLRFAMRANKFERSRRFAPQDDILIKIRCHLDRSVPEK